MTQLPARHRRMTGILLAIALLLTLAGAPVQTGIARAPKLPVGDDYIFNSVTIKTQAAADKAISAGGIRGIDVSKYQGSISWSKVANSNVQFAFIRATYGTTNDPYFVSNAQLAHENGIKVGAYHFATFQNSEQVRNEAAHFISRLKQVTITYPVVLDLEGASHKKIKRSTLTSLAVQFMDLVKAEGYNVMLYSYNNFIRDHLDVSALGDYDLWVANYSEQPNSFNHKVWQYTSYGSVSGISGRVDMNVAYEDLSGGGSKKVTVDRNVSNSIKAVLNERYNVGLPLEGLNMDNMNRAIAQGIQMEVNSQWGVSLPVDGELTREVANYISDVTFTSETGGNITYLLQCKLFYKGYYTGDLTGWYDTGTVEAVKAFQTARGYTPDGNLDAPTLYALLL